nr:hypothetical protein [Tanacetum cinerariifolium]
MVLIPYSNIWSYPKVVSPHRGHGRLTNRRYPGCGASGGCPLAKGREGILPNVIPNPWTRLRTDSNRFFWVDERVFSTVVDWRTNAPKDGMPAAGTYSLEVVRVLDTHRTPIQKQPEMLLCLVGISRRYYLGDEVYPTFLHDDDRGGYGLIQFDPCPKSYKGEDYKSPPASHEVPLLTLTAPRVIKMDEPAVTDSSGVPSTIKRSPLDFAHEAKASDQGAVVPEMPLSEDVPPTAAPGAGQAEETATMDPPSVPESRKRGHDVTDVNAPPKSLRNDHADPRPSGSSHGGKVVLPYNKVWRLPLLCLKMLQWASVTLIRYPLPTLRYAILLTLPSKSSLGIAAAGVPESKNASSPAEVRSPGSVYQLKWGVTNGSLLDTLKACQDLVDHVAPPGYFSELRHMHNEEFLRQYNVNLARIQAQELEIRNLEASLEAEENAKRAAEDKSARLSQELEKMRAQFSDLQVSNERLSQQVATLQQQVSGEEKLKAAFEEFKRQQNERVEQRESLELRQAFADAVSAGIAKGLSEGFRHGLEHGLRDAPMDVIMAALYLESDTGDDASQDIHDLRPSSSQLTIPVYPEKKKSCIVCRTHGVGSAHHARSDGVSVSAPTVVPQGLALLLVDVATQTESDGT